MKRLLTTLFTAIILTISVSSAFAADTATNADVNKFNSNVTNVENYATDTYQQNKKTVRGSLTEAEQFASTLSPPETDYSVAYLGQIFGTVGNVLQSTYGQVLGQLFKIFNKGVLVVAALYLAMTVVQVTLRAATEGSFMGQNRNVFMVWLRVALGFIFIIPSPNTGYSLLQDIFMRVVVASVGLADQTWDAALQYLRYGGELYIPPANLTTDTNIISNAAGSMTTPGPVTQILQDEVCMINSAGWEETNWKQNNPGRTAPYFNRYHHVDTDAATGIIYFPGVGNSASAGANAYSINGTSASSSPAFPACGYVTSYLYVPAGSMSTLTAGMSANQLAAAQAYSYTALKQLVLSLMPAAKELANHPNAASDPTQLAGQNNIKTVFSGILAYANLITPLQHMLEQNAASRVPGNTMSSVHNFIPRAEAQGWIMAGAFYWNLEQANKASASISLGNLMPNAPQLATMPSSVYNRFPNTQQPLMGVSVAMINQYQAPANEPTQGLNVLWKQYVGAQQNTITGPTTTANTSAPNTAYAGQIESNIFSKIQNVVSIFTLGIDPNSLYPSPVVNYNPIVTLMSLGNNLMKACVDIWIAAISITFIASIGLGICDSTSPGGLILSSGLSWIKSITMLITTVLMVPGAILAYYVPMYPFAVFTFAAVGWLLLVIEGVAAAPLVGLGVTHPEGHDFLGKADQFLMLLLSIFLRPALMVIGLVAAMVVSFVAFDILNAGLGTILHSLSNSSHSAFNPSSSGGSNFFVQMISTVMILVIFGLITLELIEQCYKLIFQLPQYIMRWIGGPQESGLGGDYGQMAGAIKGAASSTGEAAGKGLNETGGQAIGVAGAGGKAVGKGIKQSITSGDDTTSNVTPSDPKS